MNIQILIINGLRSDAGTRSQLVPYFGPMQRARPWSVLDHGPMQFPDSGLMQWARPNSCLCVIVWYVVVWGKSLSFVLTVSVLVSGTSTSKGKGLGGSHGTHHSLQPGMF